MKFHKAGKTSREISELLSVTVQTINNWKRSLINQSEDWLMEVRIGKGFPSKISDDIYLKEFTNFPTAFNREIAVKLGVSTSTVIYHRRLLKFSNKKATTTYKESDPELKKTLMKN